MICSSHRPDLPDSHTASCLSRQGAVVFLAKRNRKHKDQREAEDEKGAVHWGSFTDSRRSRIMRAVSFACRAIE